MLGMSVGTTPLDLKAATTAADDCAEIPTGEHFEFLFSVGVGEARVAVAVSKTDRMVLSCMLMDSINKLEKSSEADVDME